MGRRMLRTHVQGHAAALTLFFADELGFGRIVYGEFALRIERMQLERYLP